MEANIFVKDQRYKEMDELNKKDGGLIKEDN